MTNNMEQQVENLQAMTVSQLQHKYIEVFGEATRANNKQFLVKRIAWRIQVNAEGDISERARRRAKQLAREGDLRLQPPKGSFAPAEKESKENTVRIPFKPPKRDERLPAPGTLLGRIYKGKRVEVEVLEEGFRYEGRNYDSLTAIVRDITGSHWNGYNFFGLRKKQSK